MNKIIKIIGGLVIFVIAILVGAVAALKSMDINHFKDEIVAEIKVITGRDVKIAGDLSLGISSTPKLRVEGVTFANAPWGSSPQMIVLELLEAQINLLPLISGNIEINYLNMSGLDLLLETSAKGKANWDFLPETKNNNKTTALPSIRDVRLRDIKITYIDGGKKSKVSMIIPRMNLTQDSAGSQMEASIDAKLNDIALNIFAKLDGSENVYKIKDIKASLGASDFTGNVTINTSGPKPVVDADIKSILLNISEISGGEKNKKSQDPAKDKLFSDERIDLSGLSAFDAKIKYQADNLKTDALTLRKLATITTIKNGKLSLNPFELEVGKAGFIKARVDIDGAKKTPSIYSRMSARGLDAGKLFKEFDSGNYLTLKTDFEAEIKGAGVSVHKIMAGLSGNVRLVGKEGRINDAVISTVSAGLMAALPWVAREDSNIINCMIADIPIKSGVASINRMFMDTNGMKISGSGNANLGTEELNITISPVAKNVSLGSFAVPLSVTGQFTNPKIGINPAGAVVGTIGNVGNIVGSGAGTIGELLGALGNNSKQTTEYDPCIEVLSDKKNAPAPVLKKPTTTSPTDAVKNITNTLEKGIGGALKSIFGTK